MSCLKAPGIILWISVRTGNNTNWHKGYGQLGANWSWSVWSGYWWPTDWQDTNCQKRLTRKIQWWNWIKKKLYSIHAGCWSKEIHCCPAGEETYRCADAKEVYHWGFSHGIQMLPTEHPLLLLDVQWENILGWWQTCFDHLYNLSNRQLLIIDIHACSAKPQVVRLISWFPVSKLHSHVLERAAKEQYFFWWYFVNCSTSHRNSLMMCLAYIPTNVICISWHYLF